MQEIGEGQFGRTSNGGAGRSARPRFRFRLHPAVVINRRAKGKRCRDCKRFRFPTSRWFHRDKNRQDGFQLYCKACKRERDRRSYQRHRNERQEIFQAWKRQHRDEINAWHRSYVKEYQSGVRRRMSSFDPEDPEANQPRPSRVCSTCGEALPDGAFARQRPECRRCWNRRQPRFRVPEKRAVYRQNRRSRESGRVTHAEWAEILARWDHRCAYCGVDGPLTMDHVVPLAGGGRHAADNLVPACASCNSMKHTKAWVPGESRSNKEAK
jgi:5-methylcytosine-specific restriction endonuclease McrA